MHGEAEPGHRRAPRGRSGSAASRPVKPVTVALRFDSPPQVAPARTFTRSVRLTPSAGTFQLDINKLFPGALQLGAFGVRVTGPGGRVATTTFIVVPPGV